jgi:aminoglycoside phosphotransferase (APT) family kinase protein
VVDTWSEHPLSKRGKHRVVRYDVQARMPGGAEVQHHQWVGKFYERDGDACGVATTLRELTASRCGARGGFVVPRVLAYHAPRRLLLLSYEPGESVVKAIAADGAHVLAAMGRALAVLHAAPVTLASVTGPAAVLADLQGRIVELCSRFPAEAASLQRWRDRLQREAAPPPAAPSFLHGDLGLVQLRWQAGTIVFLDFDDCTRGDPALDLGNLLTQLRRLTLRKPEKLPDFAAARATILDAYRRSSPDAPGLAQRVAWYEQIALARKIHSLTFDRTRHPEAEAIQQRQAEAINLLASAR